MTAKNKKILEELSREFLKQTKLTNNEDVFSLYKDIDDLENPGLFFPKCVCEHFKIRDENWPQKVFIGAPQNRCYCVRKTLAYHFTKEELEGCETSAQCSLCYKFCVKNYFTRGGRIILKKKQRKS